VIVSAFDRERLQAIVPDRAISGKKHVEAGRGLCSPRPNRGSAQRIAQSVGVSRTTVCGDGNSASPKWGFEGLLRDKTRKPGKAPIGSPI